MNWTMLSIVCSVFLFIGGILAKVIHSLTRSLFKTLDEQLAALTKRLDAHVEAEEKYQDKMDAILTTMRDTLIRLDANTSQYVTVGTHLEALRKVDLSITESRHSIANSTQVLIAKLSVDSEKEFQEVKRRIEKLEDEV